GVPLAGGASSATRDLASQSSAGRAAAGAGALWVRAVSAGRCRGAHDGSRASRAPARRRGGAGRTHARSPGVHEAILRGTGGGRDRAEAGGGDTRGGGLVGQGRAER